MHLQSLSSKMIAPVFLAGAAYAASLYPLNTLVLGGCLLAYATLLWIRPMLWLVAVPALLPALDFAPWTGWFFLEELDLVLLVTAGVCYWRLASTPVSSRFPAMAKVGILLTTCAYMVGAWIGLLPLTILDANAFSSYLSHWSSLRIAKEFFWVLVFIPLLKRSASADLQNFQRYFATGMLIGLAIVSLADLWERVVFPGITQFAADYRTTAPFSAMHTGGAALDGYLALAVPFVFGWLMREQNWRRLPFALALFALASYASLTTFSRGVYLAFGSSVAILIVFFLLRQSQSRSESLPRTRMWAVGFALLAISAVSVMVFQTSGYRGFAAALIFLGSALILGGIPFRLSGAGLSIGAGMALALGSLAVVGINLGSGIFKGPYLVFGLSSIFFAVATLTAYRAPAAAQNRALLMSVTAIVWMAANAILLAYHWGGADAIAAMAGLVVLALSCVVINRRSMQGFWQLNRSSLTATVFIGIVLAAAIPTTGSYYMTKRFSTSGTDITNRMAHWQEAIAMMDKGWETEALGMGLGRYPETYFWKNLHGETPGSYSYQREDRNLFLRLGAPHNTAPELERKDSLRILQKVSVEPNTRYLFSMDVRTTPGSASLGVALCERLLLYVGECVTVPAESGAADGKWHHLEVAVNSASLGVRTWALRAPVQLQIFGYAGPKALDIDNVSLIDPISGADLIRNGSFQSANDFWFFSSDHYHLPWHVKNLALNIYFEMGWLGLLGFVSLLGYVFVSLIRRSLSGEITAATYLASLTGFMAVGLFDSLLDVPRLGLLFFLIVMISALVPAQARSRVRRRRSRTAKPVLPDATT